MDRRTRVTAVLVAVLIGSTVGFSAPQPALGVDPTLVAHWTFDDGSGATVTDASGNGNHGTLSGSPTWTTGMIGGALAFDGVDDVMDVLDSASLQPTDLTIAMWVRGDSVAPGTQILTKGTADGCSSHSYGVRAQRSALSGPADGIAVQLGTMPTASTALAWDGTWHHVAFTRVDGQWTSVIRDSGLVLSTSSVGAIPYDIGTADHLRIGGPHSGCAGESHFAGALDDVRIYSRALTVPEIATLIPPVATTTTMDPMEAEIPAGDSLLIGAHVSPAPRFNEGTLTFTARRVGTTDLLDLGTVPVEIDTGAALSLISLPVGSWKIRATFNATKYLLGSKSAEAAVRVVGLTSTIGPITSTLNPKPVDRTARLRATVVTGAVGDTVTWYRIVDGTPVAFKTTSVLYSGTLFAQTTVPSWTPGSYTLKVRYNGGATYEPDWSTAFVQVVGPRPTVTSLAVTGPHDADGSSAQAWDVLTLTPAVADPAIPPAGSVVIRLDGVYKKTVTLGTSTTLALPGLGLGTHTITAIYQGSSDHQTSSVTRSIEILPNEVDVANLAVGYATFYPVVDDYRDTVAVSGTRLESSSVAITIRNGSGSVVRTYAVPIGSGAYSRTWDGRNGAGTLQPAGTYGVTQVLTDSHGATKTWTGSVVLSHLKLVYTTTTLTLNGSAFTASGTAGSGTVTTYSDGSVRFYAPNTSSWAGVGWQFTLPAATVYTSISIGAYGNSGTPRASIGGGNYTLCPTWNTSCFDRSVLLSGSTAWVSSSLSVVDHRSGRVVRMLGETALGGFGKIYKVRCVVTYGVLK